ncbi:MAG: hypothetical protein ABIQ93_14235 [Saprospiraceae bacterium]
MSRLSAYLLGPELWWVFFYASVALAIKASGSPDKSMDDYWINLAYLVPFVAVPLTFALFWVPGVEKNWLLLRVLIACLFGAHYVLERGLNAHTEQGPGVGTAYLMGMIFTIVVMIAGGIFIKIKF